MTKTTNDYQIMRAELDSILASLQAGELDIDEATKAYERGVELLEKLEKHLKTAENKVIKIKSTFDQKKGS